MHTIAERMSPFLKIIYSNGFGGFFSAWARKWCTSPSLILFNDPTKITKHYHQIGYMDNSSLKTPLFSRNIATNHVLHRLKISPRFMPRAPRRRWPQSMWQAILRRNWGVFRFSRKNWQKKCPTFFRISYFKRLLICFFFQVKNSDFFFDINGFGILHCCGVEFISKSLILAVPGARGSLSVLSYFCHSCPHLLKERTKVESIRRVLGSGRSCWKSDLTSLATELWQVKRQISLEEGM